MNTKSVVALAPLASMASQAHAHGGHAHGHNGHVQNHDGLGVKLEFNPIYNDLNENGRLDKEEMTPDNLSILEEGHNLFATRPIDPALGLRRGQVILTIDDGPNPRVTGPILDLLDQYNIKATFFLVGSLIERNAELVREMVRRGHTVGNHTFSHDIKNITPTTIVREVTRAHQALTNALGQEPTGRLLFRAPGLGWSEPKALYLNDNSLTRRYIGPIHANLGTDAPRADWSCWANNVSAATCADYYFTDIASTGVGIILTHDIHHRPGRGNTYEMLKILLSRLENEAGGIKNKDGSGFWEFVTLADNQALAKYEVGGGPSTPPAPPAPSEKTADGYTVVRRFSNPGANVRSEVMLAEGALTNNSLIVMPGGYRMTAAQLVAVADLGQQVAVGTVQYRKVRIEQTVPGLEMFQGQIVYIWAKAF